MVDVLGDVLGDSTATFDRLGDVLGDGCLGSLAAGFAFFSARFRAARISSQMYSGECIAPQ